MNRTKNLIPIQKRRFLNRSPRLAQPMSLVMGGKNLENILSEIDEGEQNFHCLQPSEAHISEEQDLIKSYYRQQSPMVKDPLFLPKISFAPYNLQNLRKQRFDAKNHESAFFSSCGKCTDSQFQTARNIEEFALKKEQDLEGQNPGRNRTQIRFVENLANSEKRQISKKIFKLKAKAEKAQAEFR